MFDSVSRRRQQAVATRTILSASGLQPPRRHTGVPGRFVPGCPCCGDTNDSSSLDMDQMMQL